MNLILGGMQTPFWKGNEPSSFKDFLNPTKVAKRIVDSVLQQKDYFYEEEIPRGSL